MPKNMVTPLVLKGDTLSKRKLFLMIISQLYTRLKKGQPQDPLYIL